MLLSRNIYKWGRKYEKLGCPFDNGLFANVSLKFDFQEEIDKLESKIKEINEWRDQAVKDQEAQPMYEMPKMTTSLIAEKALDMDREVKFLYNKVKIGKAKAEKDKEKADKEKEKKSKKKKKSKSKDAETEGSGEEAEQTEENPENTEGMRIFFFSKLRNHFFMTKELSHPYCFFT